MVCTCGNKYHQPGCTQYLQASNFCVDPCLDPNPCVEQISTDCVIYTGPDVDCYGLVTGMTLTEVLNLLFQVAFPECTTTTTTTTAPTTTTTTII
jgi:hypothetical protein